MRSGARGALGGALLLALGCSASSSGSLEGGAPSDAGDTLPADAPLPARLALDRNQLELMAAIGRSTSMQVAVLNLGELDSGRPVVTVTGEGFSAENDSCGEAGIRAGGSCLVYISFQPTGPGTKMGMAVFQAMPGGTVSLPLLGRSL